MTRITDDATDRCPAITTYDPRQVRARPHLFPASLMRGRDFRKMVLRDNFPIPADGFREGYFRGQDISYWLQGLHCFLKVMQTAENYGVDVREVLDFGCAAGRIARHFRTQLDDVTVWAADINPQHIRWLRTHIPGNPRAVLVGPCPGLPIADNRVDLVCAFSVFTHIDEQETAWLAELRRILRPGGLAYLTVHNDDTWRALAKQDSSNRLIRSMLHTHGFRLEHLSQPIPEGKTVFHFAPRGPYRSQVFHCNSYLQEVWSRFFDIHEIQAGGHQAQSVVVASKPLPAVGES
jgi:SAM-dependent methyltransferase